VRLRKEHAQRVRGQGTQTLMGTRHIDVVPKAVLFLVIAISEQSVSYPYHAAMNSPRHQISSVETDRMFRECLSE
jgi:hypothetical protein